MPEPKDKMPEPRAIQDVLYDCEKLYDRLSGMGDQLFQLNRMGELFTETVISNKKTIFACGNGGSMCDAIHIVQELLGKYNTDRQPFPADSLSDPATISCIANDYGYSQVFSRQIKAKGKQGDLLVAISTSGNSENIIEAVKTAKSKNMFTFGLTGRYGGKLNGLCDFLFMVPSDRTSHIQEAHTAICHWLCELLEPIN